MKNILFLSMIFFALNCFGQEKKLPENFDYGQTEEGVYNNDFFDLEISYNEAWFIQNNEQINNLVEQGTEMVTGDDKVLKSAVKSAMVNTAYLLTLFKHEIGSAVDFNPSFMVIAENTKSFPGIKHGGDYLFHTKKLLMQSQMEYYFEGDIFEKKLGNSNFHVLEAKIDYLDQTITQEYFTAVTNGFSLSFVASFTNEEERNELYEIIYNIKLDQ